MRISYLAVAAVLLSAAANAQNMNAEVFRSKATALQAKGPLALFSGDVKLLMNEANAAGIKSRNQQLALIKAGQKPRYYPPKDKPRISSKEFMALLNAIPATERAQIDMTEVMTRILATKFPRPGR